MYLGLKAIMQLLKLLQTKWKLYKQAKYVYNHVQKFVYASGDQIFCSFFKKWE